MRKKKLVLIGGGGHCKVVISQLKKLEEFEIVGIVDNYKPMGSLTLGIKIIGEDEDLKSLYQDGVRYTLVTVGSVKNNLKRVRLFEIAQEIGYELPVIISPAALVDTSCVIKEGTVIMPGCMINADTSIGANCIVNTGAIIEHDCKIGDHSHIASGAHLSGGVKVGDLSFVGAGSTVIQNINIGRNVIVGAGSVVIDNICNNVTVVGTPTRVIKSNEE